MYIYIFLYLVIISILLIFLRTLIQKQLQYWIFNYILHLILTVFQNNCKSPIHIMLCKVDHFEPGNGGAGEKRQRFRVASWVKNYPAMANKHKDSDGYPPKHTWFYPPHHDTKFLKELVYLSKKGFGEIEMHLHHNRMAPFPDNESTLKKKISDCIDIYGKYGIFRTVKGKISYAFIHGDWSLDNAAGSEVCGINNEIDILIKTGCFADFTYPSLGKTQPMRVNSIYYSVDNPNKPKSYNWGKLMAPGAKLRAGLLMIQGIIGIRLKKTKKSFKISIENSNLDKADKPTRRRIDYWIRNGVVITGKSDWRFVKLHTHGAREETWDANFGASADTMFSYLEEKFNDNKKYVLHYVSAREMYNIAKAAEDGMKGNPNLYRDYRIPPYIYL